MAEINTASDKSEKAGVRKSEKLSTKVDLTPMVDLGFLLITFFMISTKWAEPKAAKIIVPAGEADMPVCNSCALTVIPTNDDRLFYYHGDLTEALEKGRFGFSNYSLDQGIGAIIRQKQLNLDRIGKPRSDLMLIIKPTNEAAYRNVVDLFDEVLINDVKHYAITDIAPVEEDILKSKIF